MTSTTADAPVDHSDEAADWDLARRVAGRVGGRDPLESSYLASSLDDDFAAATAQAETLVADYTGLVSTAGPAVCRVIDRAGWVDANLIGFRRVLSPLSERLAEAAPGIVRRGGRTVVGAELGLLLGYLSKRVLGQYDLFLPEDSGGVVFYVGPNVLNLEMRYRFPPSSFRLWVALHEVTHRAQFTGVPWLREYFMSLVDDTLRGLDPDPKRMLDGLLRAVDKIRRGEDPLGDGGIVGLFASEAQRDTLSRVQALMSLLEGHGNAVMDHLGAEHVPDQARMSDTLRQRRQTGGAQRLFYRLTGVEMKVQQYEQGERFVHAVEDRRGPDALKAAWRSPDDLPTLEEIREPDRWLDRVA